MTYDLMAGAIRRALPAVQSLDVAYADVRVSVLSAECALVSATFRRETVIATSGAASQSQGGVSWLWRNIDGRWLIVHGHISHPVDVAKQA